MHGDDKSIMAKIEDNKDMLLRTLYVTLGVTGIVIIYFIVRAVRLRKKRTKSRKYGIITQQGDRGDVEMEPLGDGNEDDEDYTVFEVNAVKTKENCIKSNNLLIRIPNLTSSNTKISSLHTCQHNRRQVRLLHEYLFAKF
ncbi:hypothetical protein Btru_060643 [Bulinus truncatus]|nr:hypothetical protein Btru_060643 [Bulinus truncatus]